jgi:hypothetical protein
MDPTLIVFAIRAAVRVGRAGTQAFNQYERDREALLPTLPKVDFTEDEFIETTLRVHATSRLKDAADLGRFWPGIGPLPGDPRAKEVLRQAALQIDAELKAHDHGFLPEVGAEVAGGALIKQWSESKEPVPPWARLALTMADVALEFFAARPSVLGIGGNGEKLIGAFAGNLAELIPDDTEAFGLKRQFGERLVEIMLRAGLETLSQHSGLVLRQEHLQQLVRESLPPLIQALPQTLSEQSQWCDVAEALLGPTAQAALTVLAARPQAYFGRAFDPGQVLGAVTQALLKQASTTGLRDQFSDAALLALFRSVAQVAVERPELFLGRPNATGETVAAALFVKVAETLKNASPPFNADLGIDLVVSALDVLRTHMPGVLDPQQPWEAMAAAAAQQIIQGLADGFKTRGLNGLHQLFSARQLTDLGRIFLIQVSKAPQVVVGDRLELQAIVQGVAEAMARDTHLLLTADDWLQLAEVAAAEAVANPGRLFKLDPSAPGDAVGTVLIHGLLAVATAELQAGGRDAGGVLFADTLREAMVIALHAASSNAKVALQNQQALQQLAQHLSDLVRRDPGRFGSQEWLVLYRRLAPKALGEGAVPLTEPLITEILAGGVGS